MLGQITKWTQQAGAAGAQAYEFGYDPVGELKSALLKDASQTILKSYTYDYDAGGSRTVEAIDSLVTGDTVNNLNQLTSRQGGTGVLPIRGKTNEPSSVTVNGSPASVKADNTFEGKAAVTAGNNTVTVVATDVNSNTTTNRYNVTVTGSGSKTLIYDPNGNLTSDGTRTFEWDALNQLTAVTSGTHRSEFTYNGLNQRVKIVEKDNGTVTSTKQFVWCPGDAQPYEERDGSNAVKKRYYTQGVKIGNAIYYYTRDHLGSIRELTDSSGTVQTRYDYDPYGRRTKLSGSIDADFGFTGHYYHQPSGLHLALYRAYNADLGRWISRDPIGFRSGDASLYQYVGNSVTNAADPYGLKTCWRKLDIVTHFGDRAEDKQGIRGHTMQRGEIAVGQWSNDRFIRGATTKEIEANQDRYMVQPYGSMVWLFVSGNESGRYKVTDYGAYDKDYPQYSPDNWADIYNPSRSARGESYDNGGWEGFDVNDDCPCPPGSSQYPEGAPGEGPWPGSANV